MTDMSAENLRVLANDASVLLDRLRFANSHGITFGGKRNLYSILGYADQISAREYRERYARGGIAKRIVEAYPRATWREGVEIYEDEDPENITPFEKAATDLTKRLKVWSILERADILAGLSTYSVILLGAPGDLESPLPRAVGGNPASLVYLQPFFGGGGPETGQSATAWRSIAASVDATIAEYDEDPRSPRYGSPLFYSLGSRIKASSTPRKVHWTRVIHVAEGCLDDNVFGIPTLENVYNLLDDLDKVTGGGAEAFWLRANQGLHVNIDKDLALPAGDNTLEKLRTDLEAYQHGLARMIRTRGVEVNALGSDVANFGPSVDSILKQIAGSKGIPLRILTGSEMGELASSQDAENWNSQVQDRRTSHAGPNIVRQFFDRLIEFGYLPAAEYEVGWPVVEEMTEPQKADLAVKLAQANAAMGEPLFTEAEIREMTYDLEPLSDEQRQEIADRASEAMERQQEAMAATAKPDGEPAEEEAVDEELKAAAMRALESGDDDEILVILEDAIREKNLDVVAAIVGLK